MYRVITTMCTCGIRIFLTYASGERLGNAKKGGKATSAKSHVLDEHDAMAGSIDRIELPGHCDNTIDYRLILENVIRENINVGGMNTDHIGMAAYDCI